MNSDRTPYRIGVVSDTHGFVNGRLFEVLEGVAMILHAGDVGENGVLNELSAIAPVVAVSGNMDGLPDPLARPLTRQIETPAGRIAMTHGHLANASAYRPETLPTYFRSFSPDIIVFGHTHQPLVSRLQGVTLFNPGAAGRVRCGRSPSAGLIIVDRGSPPRFEHIPLE